MLVLDAAPSRIGELHRAGEVAARSHLQLGERLQDTAQEERAADVARRPQPRRATPDAALDGVDGIDERRRGRDELRQPDFGLPPYFCNKGGQGGQKQ